MEMYVCNAALSHSVLPRELPEGSLVEESVAASGSMVGTDGVFGWGSVFGSAASSGSSSGASSGSTI